MSLNYLHGIDLVEIDDPTSPIRTQKTSVIGLVGTAGKGAKNTPILIVGSRTDAQTAFGKSRANSGFTIPQALDEIFDQGPVTVVVVNVIDPEVHVVEDDELDVTLTPNQGTLPKGFINSFSVATDIELAQTKVTEAAVIKTLTAVSITTTDATVTCASTTGLLAGMKLTGLAGVSAGATVLSITSATEFEMSVNATATSAGGTLTATKDAVAYLPAGATAATYFDFALGTSLASLNALEVGDKVKVSYTATLVENTDFTLNKETGVVTRLGTTNKILPGATLHFQVDRVNDELPLEDVQPLIIGDAGELTGMHALSGAKSVVKVSPKLLLATGFTHGKPDVMTANPVAAELITLAHKLKAIAYLDCEDTTKEDAVSHVEDHAGSDRAVFTFPWVKVYVPGSKTEIRTRPFSALLAGQQAVVDNDPSRGFWYTASNYVLNGVLGLSQPISFELNNSETVANYLNERNIVTIINEAGYCSWGLRTANGTFISLRRTRDQVNEAIIYHHLKYNDRPISKGLFEDILAGGNAYLRRLKTLGAVLGGKMWLDRALNTADVIKSGQAYFDYDFGPTYPLEHLTFRSHLSDGYIDEVFPTAIGDYVA